MKRILLCAALIAWSGLASAVVYKWVDAQGKVQYGDRPPDGVHAEVVTLLGNHVARAAAPKPADTPRARPAALNPNAGQPAASDPAKKAVDEDVAAAREKQCAAAQDRYKKDIDNWRLFRTGENGERVYLTSDEIDTERVNAKRDVDSLCGPPP
jgi:hypothetical protein